MSKSTLATFGILLVTAIWGSTFFIIKDAVTLIDPIDFLAVRFTIGALLPAIVFHRSLLRLTLKQWGMGLGLGGLYGLAQIAQTVGLRHTDASISGFITGTYVILTPVFLWIFFKSRLNLTTWLAVGLAAVGLGVLSITGLGSGGGLGELLTLIGAALYAVHIIVLDRWSRAMDAMSLTVVQLIGVAIVVVVLGAPGGYHVPTEPSVWGAIAYTAIVAGIVTMLLQTWAQRHISPTRVALLMTFEPVFASAFAVGFGGEDLTVRLLLGGGLILGATLLGIRSGTPEPTELHTLADPASPPSEEPKSPDKESRQRR
ncbi:DMT family transporter [Tessaracoccus caeni]|uniref:DMT family transporter n=1 Tax=Tessaracoccus caeni TaxID=3031239 RepID=UPI0023DB3464|nr:DMT family transporter [Tessaracoccus caeni]MDF1486800.1 DMT family transporter [Tessaracoccus caeni]